MQYPEGHRTFRQSNGRLSRAATLPAPVGATVDPPWVFSELHNLAVHAQRSVCRYSVPRPLPWGFAFQGCSYPW